MLKLIGKNIRNMRIEKEVTLDEFAEETGISKKYLMKIENGEAYGLTTGKFLKIAFALNVKPSILVE